MSSVTQILDTASKFTGLRKDGSERALAIEALNDVYMDACMWVQPVQENYTHTFGESKDDYDIENHNETDFGVLQVIKTVAFGAAVVAVPMGEAIHPQSMQVRSADNLTIYVEGVNYTVDYGTGILSNLTLPAANYNVQYLKAPTVPLPRLRDDDIQLPPLIRLVTVSYNSGNNTRLLRHVSENELLEHRRNHSLSGFPRLYAISGMGRIKIWPRPQVGRELTFTYVPLPPELTEGIDRPPALWDEAIWDLSLWDDARGAETTPSQIPIQFHRSVLLNGLVVQMLDKDQRSTAVAFWQQRYQDGLEKMHLWMAMYGGDPAVVLDEEATSYGRYPDEWGRGR